MNKNDLKSIVDSSVEPQWYYQVKTNVRLTKTNFSHTYTGVFELNAFLDDQCNKWGSMDPNKRNGFQFSLDFFINASQIFVQVLNNIKNDNPDNKNQKWQNAFAGLMNQSNRIVYVYDHPEVIFLQGLRDNFPASFDGALNFFTGDNNISINSRDGLIGTIQAYEFRLKGFTEITERRDAEKKSINTLKSNFTNYISKTEKEIFDLNQQLKSTLDEHRAGFEEIRKEKISEIDQNVKTTQESFDQWFKTSSTEYSEFYNSSEKEMTNLKKAYNQLLSLKEPAQYWNQRAVDLKEQGETYLKVLIGVIVVSVILLFSVLWLTPDDMLISIFSGDKSRAIRWSVVFITFISFLAYGVRILTRITFSSYHLARDAEERERLTFVYLAMIKDGSVKEEDRHLIMQSLFSRADTGLLKDDSSPTMPGASNFVSNLVKPGQN